MERKEGQPARPGRDQRGGRHPDPDALPGPQGLTQRPALRTHWTGTQATPPTPSTRGPARPGPTLPPFIPVIAADSPDPSFSPHSRAGCGVPGSLSSLHTCQSQRSHQARRPSGSPWGWGWRVAAPGSRRGPRSGSPGRAAAGQGWCQAGAPAGRPQRQDGAFVRWGLWKVT